jgi:hypothetical protein
VKTNAHKRIDLTFELVRSSCQFQWLRIDLFSFDKQAKEEKKKNSIVETFCKKYLNIQERKQTCERATCEQGSMFVLRLTKTTKESIENYEETRFVLVLSVFSLFTEQ